MKTMFMYDKLTKANVEYTLRLIHGYSEHLARETGEWVKILYLNVYLDHTIIVIGVQTRFAVREMIESGAFKVQKVIWD